MCIARRPHPRQRSGLQRNACHDELGSLRPSYAPRREDQPDIAGVCPPRRAVPD